MSGSLQDAFLARFRPKFLCLQLIQRRKSIARDLQCRKASTSRHAYENAAEKFGDAKSGSGSAAPPPWRFLRQSSPPGHTALRRMDEYQLGVMDVQAFILWMISAIMAAGYG